MPAAQDPCVTPYPVRPNRNSNYLAKKHATCFLEGKGWSIGDEHTPSLQAEPRNQQLFPFVLAQMGNAVMKF